jgi:ribulose bisphosphate carboxylase small subunit
MIDALMEHAEERVKEMVIQGYVSGELVYEDEDRSFTGYWEIKKGD